MRKLLISLIMVLVLSGCKPTDTDTQIENENEPTYIEVCYKGRNNIEWGCHLELEEEVK